jgi:hypothetical protein
MKNLRYTAALVCALCVIAIPTCKGAETKLSVSYNKDTAHFIISGNVGSDGMDLYNNQAAVTIFNPGKSEGDILSSGINGVYYYWDETEPAADGSFSADITVSGAKGLYVYNIRLPQSQSVYTGSFYYIDPVEAQQLLAEINQAADKDASDPALSALISDNFDELELTFTEYNKLAAADLSKAFLKEVFPALHGRSYVTVAEFQNAFTGEVVTQYIKLKATSDELPALIEKYSAELGVSVLTAYTTAYGDMAAKDKACLNALFGVLKSNSYVNAAQFAKYFEEKTILTGVGNFSSWTYVAKLISDNVIYLKQNGFKADEYAALSSASRSQVALSVTGKPYNTVGMLTSALNSGITAAGSPPSSTPPGGGGGGGGGSSGTGGYYPDNSEAPVPYPSATPGDNSAFSDLGGVPWAVGAVEALAEKGILNGRGGGVFAPNEYITREELAKIITLAFGVEPGLTGVTYDDVDVDSWYAPYVDAARRSGLMVGVGGGLFGTGYNVTRQDTAVTLYRAALRQFTETGAESVVFGDAEQISDYAKEAVGALSEIKVINGNGEGLFAPQESITRAECAKMTYELLKYTQNLEAVR